MNYELYFADSGVPATGLTPTFSGFLDVATSGTIGSIPTISELGIGWYNFSYIPSGVAVGLIDGGSGLGDADRYLPFKVTQEDSYLDAPVSDIPTLTEIVAGVYSGYIDGTLTASGAWARIASYCSSDVDSSVSGVYDYKNNAGTATLFTLTGTDTTRTRS